LERSVNPDPSGKIQLFGRLGRIQWRIPARRETILQNKANRRPLGVKAYNIRIYGNFSALGLRTNKLAALKVGDYLI
jgi:hypothetical protein